ncbi:MAG: NnrU family protein [Gammaproteobacteria bacterium]|nr:NnrU family protein [Gammaproteobacteria bacterium]
MTQLVAAALFFVGIHLLISGTALRDVLVRRMGEPGYRGLFSALSAAGLAWMIWAYGQARVPAVTPLSEYRALAAALVFVAIALVVFGVLTRGPTAMGGEAKLAGEDAARGIHRVTRHPMLWGFALWAATHMAFNPEPANLVFFGAFLALGLCGPLSIDAKRARRFGTDWERYRARTSNIPFLAILQGRNRLVLAELRLRNLAVAAVAYVGFAWMHARWFGAPLQ